MMEDLTIARIRQVLRGRPPQVLRDPSLYPAAVLLLVYPTGEDLCVLFTKRTSQVEHHKGEISFPGGARDEGDADLQATARRETYEEVGIRPEDVRILGELDEIRTRSGFVIHPFVGTIPFPYTFSANELEVAELLQVPISALTDKRRFREEVRLVDGQPFQNYSYEYNGAVIFGYTARILHQFLELALRE